MSKQDIVYQQIRERILNGSYRSGEPITERIVAEELGASRVPVRAALLQLQQDGLVNIIQGRGAYVRVFNPTDLQYLFETRLALEGMSARLAAGRMNPQDLDSYETQYLDNLKQSAASDSDSMASLGQDFHEAITRGCGNPVVTRMVMSIADQVRFSRRLYFPHTSRTQMLRFSEQHLEIARSIRQRKPELAEQLMREHISEAYELFRDSHGSLGMMMGHGQEDGSHS